MFTGVALSLGSAGCKDRKLKGGAHSISYGREAASLRDLRPPPLGERYTREHVPPDGSHGDQSIVTYKDALTRGNSIQQEIKAVKNVKPKEKIKRCQLTISYTKHAAQRIKERGISDQSIKKTFEDHDDESIQVDPKGRRTKRLIGDDTTLVKDVDTDYILTAFDTEPGKRKPKGATLGDYFNP